MISKYFLKGRIYAVRTSTILTKFGTLVTYAASIPVLNFTVPEDFFIVHSVT